MILKRVVVMLTIVLVWTSCAHNKAQENVQTDTESGWVLVFDEHRPGEPSGEVRMLITANYLRIDSGKEEDDFLLFDVKQNKIFSIVHEDETAFRFGDQALSETQNPKLEWRVKSEPSNVVVDNKGTQKSIHHRITINDQDCMSVIAVDGFLPEALEVLKAYRIVLASEQMQGMEFQAGEDVCHAALNIVEPAYTLKFGFPIREWNDKGYQRFLTQYRAGIVMPNHLFSIPDRYRKFGFN
ncbi:MAG: hypothetical protein OEZ43_19395 [Gammaproteobacteria bacterium]|nr:hypothetical protein [Gammaproteobacteria bacterium]